jgi:hypothetical protein
MRTSMQTVQPREWRRYGFGGPPEPWERGAQRDLDRLATSYYLDILQSRQAIRAGGRPASMDRAEELYTAATRHKHEIDYALRHPATPNERARVEHRLGSLMRIGRLLRDLVDGGFVDPAPEPLSAA